MAVARRSAGMLLSALVAIAVTPAPAIAAIPVEDVTGTITDVTVFPDRAQVTRIAHLTLGPGTHQVRFDELPIDLDADSLQVHGEGTAQVLIGGFELEEAFLGHSPAPRVAALEARLLVLKDRARALADARDVASRQLSLLRQAAARAGDAMASELAIGKARVDRWQALLALLAHQQAAELATLRTLDGQDRALADRTAPLQDALDRLRSFRQKQVHRVRVTVTVQRGGDLDLAVSYVMRGAGWTPSYDARYTAGGGSLEWHFDGQVAQQTGEDWRDVHLRLSTAEPAIGSQPPQLPSWFVTHYVPPPPMPEMEAPMAAARNETMVPEGAAPRPAQEGAATVRDEGTSVTLDLPGLVSVPSDGALHELPVGVAEMPVSTIYRIVPRVTPAAFLEVAGPQTGPWPLLPGPVKAFVDGDYVGTTRLAQEVVSGQKFRLPMGIDRNIQVERERLSTTTGVSGLFDEHAFASYRFRIALTSYRPIAQRVTVLDAYPESTAADIGVQVDQTDPDASHPRSGELRWDLTLQPRVKREIRWGYRVEWPVGQQVRGLE